MENQEMLLDRAAQIAPVIRMLALEDGKNTVKLLRCEKAIGAGMNIPRPDAAYENVLGKNTLVLSENADTDAIVAAYRAFRTENGVPAVVYRKENMPMPIRVVIHMGSGCVIYTLVACWVGWIDLSAGLWQGIGMIAAQLAAAFLIWFFFLLHYRREAKEMNERIQEMKKGKD